MKPSKTGSRGDADLFRSRLDQMINMRHELVRLGGLIDWSFFDQRFEPLYSEIGRPGVPTRLIVGLHLLKHIHNLSDEVVCERWIENPLYQGMAVNSILSSLTSWSGDLTKIGTPKTAKISLNLISGRL